MFPNDLVVIWRLGNFSREGICQFFIAVYLLMQALRIAI